MFETFLNLSSPSFKLLKSLAIGAAILIAPHTHAGLITMQGSAFSITYDDSLTGLFSTPVISGTTVYFTPTNFYALSANSSGFKLERSTFNFVVNLKQGYQLDGYDVAERGDYLMSGAGSSVGVGGQVRLFDTANPVSGAQSTSALISTSNFSMADFASHDWTALASANLNSNLWSGVRSYNVTLENILTAYTAPQSGSAFAFVEKKFAGILFDLTFNEGSDPVPVDPLPLPASVWLLFSGLAGLVAFARKRRSSALAVSSSS